jgi:FlgD Ig-like domain
MRKTLFAMLGLVALGLWALPAVAAPLSSGLVVDGPKVHPDPVPLENRAGAIGAMARGESYQGTLSGTLIKQAAATTSWFMYPGACVQRALGTWSAKSSPTADSLQPHASFPNSAGYQVGQPIPGNNLIAYTRADLSLPEKLWKLADAATPAAQRPAIIDGNRSIWCGKFDANWLVPVGYPNITYQILYFDTGAHGGNHTLTFEGNISVELNYDYVHFIGGGTGGPQAGNADPLQNRRDYFDSVIDNGHGGPNDDGHVLVTFTGSIQAAQSVATGVGTVEGAGAGQPNTVSYSISGIPDRAVYVVMTADCLFSSEDGLWPEGHGQILDLVATSDNGSIYNDQTLNGALEPPNGGDGTILKGTYGSFGCVSSRVPAGLGELWQLTQGTDAPNSDVCSPQKALASDLFFEGGDPVTNLSINKQYNAVVSCAFPVPVGTASVFATWDEYLDLPRFGGLVQTCDFRIYKDGSWGNWTNTAPGGGVVTGSLQAWTSDGEELGAATQADSVQIRYVIQCIPPFSADRANCSSSITSALLYDNFKIQVTTGVPAPIFGVFPGSVAQSTFVDGTIDGTGCTVNPCWPGNRGSDLGTPQSHNIAVHDNWNAATGDTVTLALVTGLRKGGMGMNWRRAFSKATNAGEIGPPGSEYAFSNGSYNAAHDVPRMIFRLFDPASKTWSPFDSTELVVNAGQISDADGPGGAPPETTLIDSEFNMNWPPYDKSIANATLPGGFTVNGINTYNGLRFLPRGSRMQYYFKAVDINGGVSYQFSSDNLAREVADIPTLPGSSIKAPDIIEFAVLPGAYAPGPAGSLLAGRTNTPVLNLDRVYSTWSFGYDPMTQALRGLGVRADRFRFLASGTTANGVGGHELPGQRPDRLSNFFPNLQEYPLVDSLSSWYRIMIESGHTRTTSVFNEQDAIAVEEWWRRDTGTNQGDRCLFLSGDNSSNILLNTQNVVTVNQVSIAQNVFGVQSTVDNWATGTPFPTIDDRFAGGNTAGLAAAGTFTYPVDGGCPGPNRFDGLTKVGAADAVNSATYPGGSVAGIARAREMDNVPDQDQNKALVYGFSLQFIRNPAYGTANANYTRAGIENRMRVMYRFLTGCRGVRDNDVACWPCPTPGAAVPTVASMQSDWAGQSAGFQTSTHGPLYAIQAGALATAVDDPLGVNAAPRINKMDGHGPNPFNPQTTIKFTSASAGKASVRIYNVAGALVRSIDANVGVGANEVRWNGKSSEGSALASGVYFYKIVFPNGETAKSPNNLVLVK